MRDKKFFSYLAASAYRVISKEVKNHILRHNWIFRHTCCINNTHWQSGEIKIFLCKYYIALSDTLVGSFLDVLFLLLAVILSRFLEKPRRNKDWVTEKSTYIEELVWGRSFFLLHALLSMSLFVAFFVFSLLLPKRRTCWIAPIKIHDNAMGGILCDDIMSEQLKRWKSL